jgi:hypothetical protein
LASLAVDAGSKVAVITFIACFAIVQYRQ